MQRELQRFFQSRFPPLACAFGYGSGVFKQATNAKPKMIDTLLVVNNSTDFHEENRSRNAADYSFIPRYCMPSRSIASVQERYGGRLWFNTLIPFNDNTMMKYGVVSKEDFMRDLLEWETFYLAGRMQKPVMEVECENERFQAEVHEAMRVNRVRALQLCKTDTTKEDDLLFEQIVQLSYAGDVRVGVAESPTKVKDIVTGSLQAFHKVYDPLLHVPHMDLPPAYRGLTVEQVHAKLRQTIRTTSAVQTLKGLLTAGVGKSLLYSKEKLIKRWR